MRYVNGILGGMLAVFAMLCLHDSNGGLWMSVYALGAALAFITLIPRIGLLTARMLALVATIVMFFYFAGFFMLVPTFSADWYAQGQARAAISLFLAGFAMIPVLSCYSCRMKEECPMQRRARRKLERQMRRLQQTRQHSAHHPWHAG